MEVGCLLTSDPSDSEIVGWNGGSWLFPRAVKILEIERYRRPLLAGLVLSVSSRTDSTVSVPWDPHRSLDLMPRT